MIGKISGGDQEKVELTPRTLSSCSNAFGGWWYLRLVKTNVSCLKFFLPRPVPTGPYWETASGGASVIFSIPLPHSSRAESSTMSLCSVFSLSCSSSSPGPYILSPGPLQAALFCCPASDLSFAVLLPCSHQNISP